MDRLRPAPPTPQGSDMMGRCTICGSPRAQGHHPTRRPGPGEPYFDTLLRFWLCAGGPSHHARAHDMLRDEELDFPPAGADLLTYRLRALAAHAGWMGQLGRSFAVADPAASWALRDLLVEAADRIEVREPVAR